jgi:beta-lactamase superfamily II metal-dependent hydrolase
VYEIDFLPIEQTGDLGSKSGDAITVRFSESATGRRRVVVIDGGYSYTGEAVVEQIRKWYGTDRVDLMISTHPDQDHINGLATVLDELTVGEVLIHRPHNHAADVASVSNIEVVDAIIGLAEEQGVPVTEPFTGLTRFGGQLRILGPTEDYYEELLAAHINEVMSGEAGRRSALSKLRERLGAGVTSLFDRILPYIPAETLGEDGETGPRNNSSVVTLLTTDSNERMIFTGDAGIPALDAAWDEYDRLVNPQLIDWSLNFFQAPHHGSCRNLSPSLLNRIFGKPGETRPTITSFVSSAKNDPKHPSPKVTNALRRRGLSVYATEGRQLLHHSSDAPPRGWSAATPVPIAAEDDD